MPQHVEELVRLATTPSTVTPSPVFDELHALFSLLFMLSPEASTVALDPTAHATQLRRSVSNAQEAYLLLSRVRGLPLDLVEGRAELPDPARVRFIKARICGQLDGLDVDFVTLGFPERRMPAMTLLVALRMIDMLRPPPEVSVSQALSSNRT
jgi:hypothetical protein